MEAKSPLRARGKFCATCGEEYGPEELFCGLDGDKLISIKSPDVASVFSSSEFNLMFCQKCDLHLKDKIFCTKCGTKLAPTDSANPKDAPAVAAPKKTPQPPDTSLPANEKKNPRKQRLAGGLEVVAKDETELTSKIDAMKTKLLMRGIQTSLVDMLQKQDGSFTARIHFGMEHHVLVDMISATRTLQASFRRWMMRCVLVFWKERQFAIEDLQRITKSSLQRRHAVRRLNDWNGIEWVKEKTQRAAVAVLTPYFLNLVVPLRRGNAARALLPHFITFRDRTVYVKEIERVYAAEELVVFFRRTLARTAIAKLLSLLNCISSRSLTDTLLDSPNAPKSRYVPAVLMTQSIAPAPTTVTVPEPEPAPEPEPEPEPIPEPEPTPPVDSPKKPLTPSVPSVSKSPSPELKMENEERSVASVELEPPVAPIPAPPVPEEKPQSKEKQIAWNALPVARYAAAHERGQKIETRSPARVSGPDSSSVPEGFVRARISGNHTKQMTSKRSK